MVEDVEIKTLSELKDNSLILLQLLTKMYGTLFYLINENNAYTLTVLLRIKIFEYFTKRIQNFIFLFKIKSAFQFQRSFYTISHQYQREEYFLGLQLP